MKNNELKKQIAQSSLEELTEKLKTVIVSKFNKEAEEFNLDGRKEDYSNLVVNDKKSLDSAKSIRAEHKTIRADLKRMKDKFKAPFLEINKAVDTVFKENHDKATEVIEIISQPIDQYATKLAEQEIKARKSQEIELDEWYNKWVSEIDSCNTPDDVMFVQQELFSSEKPDLKLIANQVNMKYTSLIQMLTEKAVSMASKREPEPVESKEPTGPVDMPEAKLEKSETPEEKESVEQEIPNSTPQKTVREKISHFIDEFDKGNDAEHILVGLPKDCLIDLMKMLVYEGYSLDQIKSMINSVKL